MQNFEVSPIQLDALKEIGNISAANAATAFSQLVSRRVDLSVSEAHVVSIAKFEEDLRDESMLGVYQRILGQASGFLLVTFSKSNALELVKLISGHGDLSIDQDILQELVNIVNGSYLTTLSKITNFVLMPTVPRVIHDFKTSSLENIFRTFKVPEQTNVIPAESVIFLNKLLVKDTSVVLYVYLIPDPKALPIILKAVGAS